MGGGADEVEDEDEEVDNGGAMNDEDCDCNCDFVVTFGSESCFDNVEGRGGV